MPARQIRIRVKVGVRVSVVIRVRVKVRTRASEVDRLSDELFGLSTGLDECIVRALVQN